MPLAVEVADYSYRYPHSSEGLDAVTLRVEHGEKVALIGPNGAGKSTLLLAINMFVRGEGVIRIDGMDATARNARRIRESLGCVLQDPDEQLFMPTVFEDVAFGPMNLGLARDEVERRTRDALATVGLAGMENRAPYHLSAGQKRAAAIATVLSMRPKIITMDEPDTSLDPRSRRNLLSLLKSLPQTLLVATCNMDFALALCERAVLIDHGKVVADGPAGDVMSRADLMEAHGLEVPAALRAPC